MPKRPISEFEDYLFYKAKDIIFNSLKRGSVINGKIVSNKEFLILRKYLGMEINENSYHIFMIKIKTLRIKYFNSRNPFSNAEYYVYNNSDKSSKKSLFRPRIQIESFDYDQYNCNIEKINEFSIAKNYVYSYCSYVNSHDLIDIGDFKLKDVKEYMKNNGHSMSIANNYAIYYSKNK